MKKFASLLLAGLAVNTFADEPRFDTQVLNQFQSSQVALQSAVASYCSGETDTKPVPEFRAAAAGWFDVSGLQLPATEFMQTEFVYIFWPDAKDRLRNQVKTAFAQDVHEQNWNEITAAAKTLSAVEFALTLENSRDYCDWMTVITEHQVAQTQQLVSLQEFYDFGVAEQLAALHGTALTIRVQLNQVLARPEKVIWQLGPAWRSEGGWQIAYSLLQQLEGLLALFETRHADINTWQSVFSDFEISDDAPDLDTLTALNTQVEALAKYVESTLAPSLDIYMGFNNFDGD